MLHLCPDLVDADAMEATYLEEPYELGIQDLTETGRLSVYRTFEEYSESGAIGDPHLASAETGERIYRLLGDKVVALLETIHEQTT